MMGQKLFQNDVVQELGFPAQVILCHLTLPDLEDAVVFTSCIENGYMASGAVYRCFA